MDSDTIQTVQNVLLKLLKIFINICEKHNLRYYVGGGTMLGAIRHKGFIPWDDDADIDMPRKDYQKFLEVYADELKDYPECQVSNIHTDNSPIAIARLIDNSFKVKKKEGIILDYITPIWLDIVPVDGLPDNLFQRKMHMIRLAVLKEFYHMSVLKYGGVQANEDKKSDRPWYKKVVVWVGTKYPIEKIFKYETWINKYEQALTKYSFYRVKMAGTFISRHGKKSIFPVEWYGKGTKYQFEDIEVIGVDNYDAWLTQLYGDYMKLPDEKDRTGHNFELVNEEQQS